jgi:hypothetical protein
MSFLYTAHCDLRTSHCALHTAHFVLCTFLFFRTVEHGHDLIHVMGNGGFTLAGQFHL